MKRLRSADPCAAEVMSAETTASSPSSDKMEQAEDSRDLPLKSITIWYTGERPKKLDLGSGDFSLLGVWHGVSQHIPSIEEESTTVCKVCNMDFSSSLQQHVHAWCHKEGQKEMQVCTVCHSLLKDSATLQRHVKSHADEVKSRENILREGLEDEESLLMDVEACEEDNDGLYKRSRCGESFMQEDEILAHQRIHHQSELLKCGICAQECGTSESLKTHEQTHSREQMLACPVCGEIFCGVGQLESHLKSHTNSLFTCHQCGMVCKSLETLQSHLLFHKGHHPFLCRVCGLSFPKSNQLQEHIEIHSSETRLHREYSQEAVDQQHAFKRRRYLKNECSDSSVGNTTLPQELQNENCLEGHRHKAPLDLQGEPLRVPQTARNSGPGVEVLIIQGDFQCRQCDKVMESSKLLREHVLSHSGDQLLLCTQCGEVFDHKDKLLQHSKTHLRDCRGSVFHRRGSRQSSRRRNSSRNHATQRLSFRAEKVASPPEFHCMTCQLSFGQAAHLQMHMEKHSGEHGLCLKEDGESSLDAGQLSSSIDMGNQEGGDHVCDICFRSFAVKQHLVDHMRIHDNERPYQCMVCGIAFKQRSGLMNHSTMHRDPKFKCTVCGKMFRRAGCLKDHSRIHTGEKPYECYVCGMKFAQRATLKSHTEKHPEPLNKACNECGEVYHHLKDLVDHMKTHLRRARRSGNEPKKTYTRRNPKETEDHMKTNLENMPFKCDDCGEGFLYRGSLLKHRVIHVGKYHCLQCGKRFISQGRLERHANTHRMRKRIRKKSKCEDCGRIFSNKTNMERHRKIHTGEKPFSCELCGKRFIQAGNLTYHLRTHSGEMTHQCDRCGKSFNASSKLLVHMRVHTGVRPFKCKECGKAFKQSHQLKCHQRMHTGERPFSCSECHKTFSRPGNLQLHLKMHRGEKSHICKHCGKGFVQSSNLKVHLRTHVGKESEHAGVERVMEFGQSLQNQQGWQYMW